MSDSVNHPAHYGGAENPYEAIKVIEAWGLGFCLGNCIKYIARAGKKGDVLEDLKKAAWYLQREVENLERGQLMSSWVQEPVQVDESIVARVMAARGAMDEWRAAEKPCDMMESPHEPHQWMNKSSEGGRFFYCPGRAQEPVQVSRKWNPPLPPQTTRETGEVEGG